MRSGGVWSQQQKLLASDAAEADLFGTSVAISGETVVVGAPDDDDAMGSRQGSAYVFVRSSVSLEPAAETPGLGRDWRSVSSATSVAISGETVVVGALVRRVTRLGLCLCAQRWSLEPAAEAGGLGRGGR